MTSVDNERKQSKIPPQLVLLGQITALWLSKAIEVAALLAIPDLLKDGPKSVRALAEASQSDEQALYRLLRALAAYGIFSQDENRVFSQSEISNLLRSDMPGSMRNTALMIARPWGWQAWGVLERSVRGEGPAFDAVYGRPIWQFLEAEPLHERIFSAAMSELAASVNPLIVEAYDFSHLHTLVDVGGGQGSLLAAILTKYSHLRGVLFDRPSIVAGMQAPRASTFATASPTGSAAPSCTTAFCS